MGSRLPVSKLLLRKQEANPSRFRVGFDMVLVAGSTQEVPKIRTGYILKMPHQQTF